MASSAAPPWETIVNQVIVAGNYHEVTAAADLWRLAFRQVDGLRERLEHLSRTSAESWTGGGADAFRAHVKKLVDAVRTTADAHRAVTGGLDACAGHLRGAFQAIPIPEWMYADVQQRQRTVLSGGSVAGYPPGAFLTHFELEYPDADLEAAKEFLRGYEQQAQTAYVTLCERYREALAQMPKGTRVTVPAAGRDAARAAAGSTPATPTQTATTQPTTQLPTSPTTPAATAPNLDVPTLPAPSIPDLPPLDPIVPPDLDLPDLDPVDVPDTGLAGVGGGGELRGLGGGLGGGGGLKVPALAPPVTLPESVMAPVRTTTAKGRVGAGPGGGGASGPTMAPMMGGFAPPGAHPDAGKETTTALKETSAAFAADDSIPPGVVG